MDFDLSGSIVKPRRAMNFQADVSSFSYFVEIEIGNLKREIFFNEIK